MSKLKGVSLILVIFFVVSSCSSISSSLKRLGFRSYKNAYTEELKDYTRSYTLYRDFTTVAVATVTRFNKPLFIDYIRSVFPGKYKKLSSKYNKFLSEFDKYDIYYVAFYTPDMSLNNLEEENTFWNVYLSSCGKILKPISIVWVDRNDWRAGWLYSVGENRWMKEYIVKFNKNKCKHPIFVISSILGSLDMKF